MNRLIAFYSRTGNVARLAEDMETTNMSLADHLTNAEAKQLNDLLDKVRG